MARWWAILNHDSCCWTASWSSVGCLEQRLCLCLRQKTTFSHRFSTTDVKQRKYKYIIQNKTEGRSTAGSDWPSWLYVKLHFNDLGNAICSFNFPVNKIDTKNKCWTSINDHLSSSEFQVENPLPSQSLLSVVQSNQEKKNQTLHVNRRNGGIRPTYTKAIDPNDQVSAYTHSRNYEKQASWPE